MRQMGYPVPDFDFTVPGVTSISVDMHKYGYAAKGSSVILHRDRSLRRHRIFSCMETTTYAIVNPTVLSSKTGGPLAGSGDWGVSNFGTLRQIFQAVSLTDMVAWMCGRPRLPRWWGWSGTRSTILWSA
jgi:hypothetical protein